jgi:predicted O-methyltransferase YrrM
MEHTFPDYQRACYYARTLKQYNCTFYHGDANVLHYETLCAGKMDLIYIDGRKSDYLAYLHCTANIVAPHTTIIFDDVIKYAHKTPLLYDYLAEKQIKYELVKLDDDDGIMIIENAGLQIGLYDGR